MNENTIVSFLNEKFNISNVIKITKLNRGSAEIYKIETSSNSYILKEFQENYRIEDILKEVTVIEHLNKKRIQVPKYIPTNSNQYFFVNNKRVIILQKFIDGYIIEANTGNYEQVIASARNLGNIINALDDLDYALPKINSSNWYQKATFEASVNKYKKLLADLPEINENEMIKNDINRKIEIIESVINSINTKGIEQITYKNTHGDYSVMQFIYKEDKIVATLDFATASYMPIIWEVIRSYSYIDKECIDGVFNINHFIEYVKEFDKSIKLNYYDLKYMVYIYLFQLLNSDYGYKQYLKDNKRIDLLNFGILRTKMCMFLYDNLEILTNKLIKEIYEKQDIKKCICR